MSEDVDSNMKEPDPLVSVDTDPLVSADTAQADVIGEPSEGNTRDTSNMLLTKIDNMDAKLDDVLAAIKVVPQQLKDVIKGEMKQQSISLSAPGGTNTSSKGDKNKEFDSHLSDLKVATSMKSIKANELIKNIFFHLQEG